MARTLNTIYDAMAREKSEQIELTALQPDVDTAQALLADLTTPSRVARWRFMLWVVAVAIWVHERLWDAFRAEVEALAAGSHIGTLRWYVEKAKAFQYGHALVIENNVPVYAVDDPASRIIARAAGKEQGGYVLLKVAKEVSGALVPLGESERAALDAYIDEIKMAGTIVNILTANPDLLLVSATVYYDPLVMTANGSLILEPAVFPVRDAINAYLANLPFGGEVVLTHLVDAMQAARGVINPVLGSVQAKYGGFAYTPVAVKYEANAGHVIIDPAAPLSTTIVYVPA